MEIIDVTMTVNGDVVLREPVQGRWVVRNEDSADFVCIEDANGETEMVIQEPTKMLIHFHLGWETLLRLDKDNPSPDFGRTQTFEGESEDIPEGRQTLGMTLKAGMVLFSMTRQEEDDD